MEIINALDKKEISSAILRLHRDMSKMEILINEIESKNLSIDRKLSKADELTTKLKVYDYISNQLLNIAEKWCADNQSPVYWAVMNNKMETCSHCNSGQSSCGSEFYITAQGIDTTTVDYNFCDDCQSVYSVDDTCDTCDLCESSDTSGSACCQGSCFTCDTCQACDTEQSSRPNTCYSCYISCQGRDGCETCDTCQGCVLCISGDSVQECISSYNVQECISSYNDCTSDFTYCYQDQ